MPAAQRQPDPGVIGLLLDEPYRFEFFQAVRVIEQWLRRNGVAHDRTLLDHVRFQNSVSLGFPASQIEALSAAAVGELRQFRIRPAFMGLLGASGALPLHYSERIAAHEFSEKDEGPRAFLDLFSDRALALFYQAWGKYRLECKLDRDGEDGFLPMLLALAGMQPRAAAPRDGIGDQTMAYFAAQLRSRTVSAATVGGVLAEYFDVPIQVGQFAGVWDVLRDGQQTRLGEANCCLGEGATLGLRIWRHDLAVCVRIGPLAREGFDRFLPGSAGARALEQLLGMFAAGVPYRDVQLILRADDVQGARLNGAARLGLDAFMLTRPAGGDRGDVCFRLGS